MKSAVEKPTWYPTTLYPYEPSNSNHLEVILTIYCWLLMSVGLNLHRPLRSIIDRKLGFIQCPTLQPLFSRLTVGSFCLFPTVRNLFTFVLLEFLFGGIFFLLFWDFVKFFIDETSKGAFLSKIALFELYHCMFLWLWFDQRNYIWINKVTWTLNLMHA